MKTKLNTVAPFNGEAPATGMTEYLRERIRAVLSRSSSKCLDDEADSRAVEDALMAEIGPQFAELGVASSQYALDALLTHEALEDSVCVQSHYARELNAYDGGVRMSFASADHWMERLAEVRGGD